MNLEKLTPAPWFYTGMDLTDDKGKEFTEVFVVGGDDVWIARMRQKEPEDDAEFIALARNAFDVMMRRGWTLYMDGGGYWIACESQSKDGVYHGPIIRGPIGEVCWYTGLRPDPFTALVEADRWHVANVEGKP
jgi:hypothetical protein